MTIPVKRPAIPFLCRLLCGAVLAGRLCSAHAGGVDRSYENISPLFEPGSYAEFGLAAVDPTVRGTDVASRQTGNIVPSYVTGGLAYKQDINKQLSFAFILDESMGANLKYPSAADGGSIMLGGTAAKISVQELKGLMRFKFNDAFAIHGGVRIERMSGSTTLGGQGNGPLNGYQANLAPDIGLGYLVGASFEKPEIALRADLTYYSSIEHKNGTTENISTGNSTTDITTPQSVNLRVQTGVAPNTLVFGEIRWVQWSKFRVSPPAFAEATGGASLTDIANTTTYSLGALYRFKDSFSGLVFLAYEGKSGSNLASPFAPYQGSKTVGLGAIYSINKIRVTAVASYSELGGTQTGAGDTTLAVFGASKVLGLGVRVGMSF